MIGWSLYNIDFAPLSELKGIGGKGNKDEKLKSCNGTI